MRLVGREINNNTVIPTSLASDLSCFSQKHSVILSPSNYTPRLQLCVSLSSAVIIVVIVVVVRCNRLDGCILISGL